MDYFPPWMKPYFMSISPPSCHCVHPRIPSDTHLTSVNPALDRVRSPLQRRDLEYPPESCSPMDQWPMGFLPGDCTSFPPNLLRPPHHSCDERTRNPFSCPRGRSVLMIPPLGTKETPQVMRGFLRLEFN